MYDYKVERKAIFSDKGQREFLKVRDKVQSLLKSSGAFMMFYALTDITGSTWTQMAYIDRLVELGEIKEVTSPDVPGQGRVFIKRS